MWTPDHVCDRLCDAYKVERRLPGTHHQGAASSWPATVLHEFVDVVYWDDARDRVWDNWACSLEVSQMEETFGWLGWLTDPDEKRFLSSWAWLTSRGRKVSKELNRRGISKTTFYRKRDSGAARIADRLNHLGVEVR
jgi:hypothetical protein